MDSSYSLIKGTLVQKRFFEKLIENVLLMGNLRFETTKTPKQGGQDYGTL